jgi:hypothetical protein
MSDRQDVPARRHSDESQTQTIPPPFARRRVTKARSSPVAASSKRRDAELVIYPNLASLKIGSFSDAVNGFFEVAA